LQSRLILTYPKGMKLSKQRVLQELQGLKSDTIRTRDLIKLLGLSRSDRFLLRQLLKELTAEGQIIRLKNNRYGLTRAMSVVTGRLQGHRDGYGFVIPDQADLPAGKSGGDIFIRPPNLGDAMHTDRVMVRIERIKPGGLREGRILKVLERGLTRIVGRIEEGRRGLKVVPTDSRIIRDIFVPSGDGLRTGFGKIAIVEILDYPTDQAPARGRIVKVLGGVDDPRIDAELILHEFGLPPAFPARIRQEAERIPDSVTAGMREGRRDLRDLPTVTVDGEQAKDFDDAISIQPLPHHQFRLFVHIADVAAYVDWDTALDLEARSRGTSVYLPDAVVPMFPEKLSNGICSLNPKLDRLTLTVEMLFDSQGQPLDDQIYESVIRSQERMTYTAVKEILVDRDPAVCQRYQALMDDFRLMEALCLKLRHRRLARGSIDFDLPEPEIELDVLGQPTAIFREERSIAHQIIEEFMLAANQAVARHLTQLGLPMIYRIHEPPDPKKIEAFRIFSQGLGIGFTAPGPIFRPPNGAVPEKEDTMHPKSFQALLEHAKGSPHERLINHLLLRSMKQARYSTQNLGHFGLAFDCYTHFTSPIRRYPDLVVHRILKETFKAAGHRRKVRADLKTIAEHASDRERLSMEAEREAVKLKKARFMGDKIGEEFGGFITGVASFGLFVELEDVFVEGLIPVTRLEDDDYLYLQDKHCLLGRRHRRMLRIADPVKIRVEQVDLEKRQVEFALLEARGRRLGTPSRERHSKRTEKRRGR
jgi:ribonuclease R